MEHCAHLTFNTTWDSGNRGSLTTYCNATSLQLPNCLFQDFLLILDHLDIAPIFRDNLGDFYFLQSWLRKIKEARILLENLFKAVVRPNICANLETFRNI